MVSCLEIVLGLLIAYWGYVHVPSKPLAGGCELFVSGFLILRGVESLFQDGKKAK